MKSVVRTSAMKGISLFIFVAFLEILIPFYYAQAIGIKTTEQVNSDLDVNFQNGLLTVKARNRTLEEVLYAIGEKADIEVNINGELSSKSSTWAVDNLPLSKAIKNLVGRHNIVMNYDSPESEESVRRVSKLWVFGHTEVTANSTHFQVAVSQEENIDTQDQFDQAIPSNQEQGSEDTDEQSYIKHLSKILKEEDDPSLRLQAVEALREIGGVQASEALAGGLNDSNPSVRIKVINSLGYLEADSIVPITGQVLYSDSDPEVRLAAVEILAEQDSEVSVVFLRVALEDKNKKVREMARSAILGSQ